VAVTAARKGTATIFTGSSGCFSRRLEYAGEADVGCALGPASAGYRSWCGESLRLESGELRCVCISGTTFCLLTEPLSNWQLVCCHSVAVRNHHCQRTTSVLALLPLAASCHDHDVLQRRRNPAPLGRRRDRHQRRRAARHAAIDVLRRHAVHVRPPGASLHPGEQALAVRAGREGEPAERRLPTAVGNGAHSVSVERAGGCVS
jgi:hypothetical protein